MLIYVMEFVTYIVFSHIILTEITDKAQDELKRDGTLNLHN